jgi:hypothetical protein
MNVSLDSPNVNSISPLEIDVLDSSTSTFNRHSSLLPRSAWTSQMAYLRILFRVKKRLDQIESIAKQI